MKNERSRRDARGALRTAGRSGHRCGGGGADDAVSAGHAGGAGAGSGVAARESGDDVHLADLGEGTSFGEDALLTNNKRNATVRMNTRGVLLRLYKDDFLELLDQPALDWVTGKEAANLIKGGAQWLDVRHEMEFQQSRLPGATNLPLHEIRQRMEELNQNQHYICYCNSGRRSSAAAFSMAKAGFKVSVLVGGLQQLMAAPVKKAS